MMKKRHKKQHRTFESYEQEWRSLKPVADAAIIAWLQLKASLANGDVMKTN